MSARQDQVDAKEEPDCYACADAGCPECDGSQIDRSQTFTFTGEWPQCAGGWGGAPPLTPGGAQGEGASDKPAFPS